MPHIEDYPDQPNSLAEFEADPAAFAIKLAEYRLAVAVSDLEKAFTSVKHAGEDAIRHAQKGQRIFSDPIINGTLYSWNGAFMNYQKAHATLEALREIDETRQDLVALETRKRLVDLASLLTGDVAHKSPRAVKRLINQAVA